MLDSAWIVADTAINMVTFSRYRIVTGIFSGLVAILIFSMPWSVAAAALNSPLQYGDQGSQVTALQQALADLGYFDHEITGYFGTVTQAAVIKFQTVNNISPAEGYFGPLTLAKLKSGASVSGGVTVGASTPAPPQDPTSNSNIDPNPSSAPDNLSTTGNLSTATRVKNFAVSGIEKNTSIFSSIDAFLSGANLDAFSVQEIGDARSFWDVMKNNFSVDPGIALWKFLMLFPKGSVESQKIEALLGEGSTYFAKALSDGDDFKSFSLPAFDSIPWTRDWLDCNDQYVAEWRLAAGIINAYKENSKMSINIVAHSHGAVIAYNTLRWLETNRPEIKIGNFITMGTIIEPGSYVPILNPRDDSCLSLDGQFNLYQKTQPGDANQFRRPTNIKHWINVFSPQDADLSKKVDIADENVSFDALTSYRKDRPTTISYKKGKPVYSPPLPAFYAHSQYYQDENIRQIIFQCGQEGTCSWNTISSPVVPTPVPHAPASTASPPPLTPVPTPPVSAACNFTRDLYQGVSGNDVLCLQRYLNSSGFIIAASGPGSPGNETNYYGPLMSKAVSKWQIANNISPASGNFGPLSRAKFNVTPIPLSPAPTPSQPLPPQTPTPTPPSSAPSATVNPHLLNTPVSAPKGTTFFFQGTYFTPRGSITEFITKPNGENSTTHYQTDDNGRYSKNYGDSVFSMFGTYTIYWIDDTTGKRSNTVNATILAGNVPPIQTSNSELLQYKNFDLIVHQIRKTDGLEVPASYQYRDGKGLLLIDIEWLINEAKQSGWKYEILKTTIPTQGKWYGLWRDSDNIYHLIIDGTDVFQSSNVDETLERGRRDAANYMGSTDYTNFPNIQSGIQALIEEAVRQGLN